MSLSPFILGIAGGSGSGKSTISRAILEALPPGKAVLLEQDHYYRAQGHLPLSERERVNYDHPDALELNLLCDHLDALRSGACIVRPTPRSARQAAMSDPILADRYHEINRIGGIRGVSPRIPLTLRNRTVWAGGCAARSPD